DYIIAGDILRFCLKRSIDERNSSCKSNGV
ncbi:MAG: hypothetical protein ACI8O8_003179, partial [Oleiphilaceae bacterium]